MFVKVTSLKTQKEILVNMDHINEVGIMPSGFVGLCVYVPQINQNWTVEIKETLDEFERRLETAGLIKAVAQN